MITLKKLKISKNITEDLSLQRAKQTNWELLLSLELNSDIYLKKKSIDVLQRVDTIKFCAIYVRIENFFKVTYFSDW